MKLRSATIALLSLIAMPSARTEETSRMIGSKPILTYEDVRQVAPQLAAYTQDRLLGDVWKRPGLAGVVCGEQHLQHQARGSLDGS